MNYLEVLDGVERWGRVMESAINDVYLLPISAMKAKEEASKIVAKSMYSEIESLMNSESESDVKRLDRLARVAEWYEWQTEAWSRGNKPEPDPLKEGEGK